MSASPVISPRGTQLGGRYRLLRKLGSGATGTVYLADDTLTERRVAIKVIHARRLDGDALKALQREFAAVARLRHPQIARAHDFGYSDPDGRPFFTREYIEGRPLEGGPPDTASATDAASFLAPIRQLLDALAYLHAHELLHLDVHAGNLIVSEDPLRGAVLIDIGLPRPKAPRPSDPSTVSPRSFPPELLRGESPSITTDIYAAGRLLLYRLTGDHEGEPKLPSEIPGWGAAVTRDLERILVKALEPERQLRFPSAVEFRQALDAALGERRSLPPHAEPGEALLGRDRELELVTSRLRDARAGRAAAIWFHGPAGVGRSRLLTETRWRAQLMGLDVLDVRFLPDLASSTTLEERVRAHAGGDLTRAGWLSPLAREHGGTTQERARRSAEAFFDAPAPPLVLLLDDLENADRESQLLARSLVEAASRRPPSRGRRRGLLVIIATRETPPRSLPARSDRRVAMRVRPLRLRDVQLLLRSLIRPLNIRDATLKALSRKLQGNPLRVRQLARALRERYPGAQRVPPDAVSDSDLWTTTTAEPPAPHTPLSKVVRDVLRVLSVLGRSVDLDELADLTAQTPRKLRRELAGPLDDQIVQRADAGRKARYYLSSSEWRDFLLASLEPAWRRRLHRRVVERLEGRHDLDLSQREALCRHLLAAGMLRRGAEAALETSVELQEANLHDHAVRLLEDAARHERSWRRRLRIAERISELHELAGDHLEGIDSLESPFLQARDRLPRSTNVRLSRRLGVHYHRAGHAGRAVELFHSALSIARLPRDREELVLIHSELAEIHTLRSEYERAEAACVEGLRILDSIPEDSVRFRRDMEVTLRATLGHLEMRRLELKRSRDEFEKALELCHSRGTVGLRALVLNNLGIVHNQLNEFARARECFHEAERLLQAAGERNARIHIACNLALIAAKLGETQRADEEMEKAERLLKDHPGERLEFFLSASRGAVQHHLGRMDEAVATFEEALPRGRKLGDVYIVRFSEIYLAEALLVSGRYREAAQVLRASLRAATREGPPVLRRMAAARLLCLGELIGLRRMVRSSREALAHTPRTRIALLETWNDLFGVMAAWVAARRNGLADPAALPSTPEAEHAFESVQAQFASLGIPAGERLARIARVFVALAGDDLQPLRALTRQIDSDAPSDHRLIGPLQHLAVALASQRLGDVDRCDQRLRRSAAQLVGAPFLELDWLIELAACRLEAEHRKDPASARHHLHRALQARDLIARQLPRTWQDGFLGHRRFAALEAQRQRLESTPQTRSTPTDRRAASFHGIIGSAPALRRVFETLERIRTTDLCVLIRGATGTGKELVARAIHRMSPRREGPFFCLHCASLPPELFESELFGCEAGAFTGAETAREGLLEHLEGGTLLLDEITHLSPRTQTKLLHVLDSRTVRPLGGLDTRRIDVRFLASSAEPLESAVDRGDLRRDLYFRLREVELELPSLAERREDIPALVRHFVELHARRLERQRPTISPEAVLKLAEHSWPGNVRELESTVLSLLVTASPGAVIDASTVGEQLRRHAGRAPEREPGEDASSLFPARALSGRDLGELRTELERSYLTTLFLETSGDIRAMTDRLGVKRSNLYTWLRRVGLDVRELRRRLEDER